MTDLTEEMLKKAADRIGYTRIIPLDQGGYAGILQEPGENQSGHGVHIPNDACLVRLLLSYPSSPRVGGGFEV